MKNDHCHCGNRVCRAKPKQSFTHKLILNLVGAVIGSAIVIVIAKLTGKL